MLEPCSQLLSLRDTKLRNTKVINHYRLVESSDEAHTPGNHEAEQKCHHHEIYWRNYPGRSEPAGEYQSTHRSGEKHGCDSECGQSSRSDNSMGQNQGYAEQECKYCDHA
jgi:hypothetical protein